MSAAEKWTVCTKHMQTLRRPWGAVWVELTQVRGASRIWCVDVHSSGPNGETVKAYRQTVGTLLTAKDFAVSVVREVEAETLRRLNAGGGQ